MGARDKEILTIQCDRCGKSIQIKFGSWRRNKNGPHYCKDCQGAVRHEWLQSLPEEERKEILARKNEAISKGWKNQSDETKKKISEDRIKSWDADRRQALSDRMIRQWSAIAKEERKQRVQPLEDGRKTYWEDINNIIKHSNRARKKWFDQPKEEQERILKAVADGRKRYYESLTPEQKAESISKSVEGRKKRWSKMSTDEKIDQLSAFLRARSANIDFSKLHDNEKRFITDYLDPYKFQYDIHWQSTTKHPDFDVLFPNCPYRPNSVVYPYHEWDFIIHTLSGNVLVDIDGSVHDPRQATGIVTDKAGNRYAVAEYNAWKDAQRPYQTDGYDAFVIKCYNDHLCSHTLVNSLQTGEDMKLDAFIGLLVFMNFPDNIIHDLMKGSS